MTCWWSATTSYRSGVCDKVGHSGGEAPAELVEELIVLRGRVARLRAENSRLLRLLELTPKQAVPPGPVQTGFFEAPPGLAHAGSPPEVKVGFFGALFAARTDLYAQRWENPRTGRSGWLPAVRGGWRKGARHADRDYLPLTEEVLTALVRGVAPRVVSAVGRGSMLVAGGGF